MSEEKWKEEIVEFEKENFISAGIRGSFARGYLQACQKRQEEIEYLLSHIKELKKANQLLYECGVLLEIKNGSIEDIPFKVRDLMIRIRELEAQIIKFEDGAKNMGAALSDAMDCEEQLEARTKELEEGIEELLCSGLLPPFVAEGLHKLLEAK